jgi:hypothetical protein
VIIDFSAKEISHLVVTLDGPQPVECEVRVDQVAATSPERIRLRCTRQELLQGLSTASGKRLPETTGVDKILDCDSKRIASGTKPSPADRRAAA